MNKPPRQPLRERAGLLGDIQTIVVNGGVVVLLIMGIAGVLYSAFKPGGWFAVYAGGALDGGVASIFFGFIGLMVAGYMVRRWFDSVDAKSNRGDLILYAGMILGAYFTYQLLVNGSF